MKTYKAVQRKLVSGDLVWRVCVTTYRKGESSKRHLGSYKTEETAQDEANRLIALREEDS